MNANSVRDSAEERGSVGLKANTISISEEMVNKFRLANRPELTAFQIREIVNYEVNGTGYDEEDNVVELIVHSDDVEVIRICNCGNPVQDCTSTGVEAPWMKVEWIDKDLRHNYMTINHQTDWDDPIIGPVIKEVAKFIGLTEERWKDPTMLEDVLDEYGTIVEQHRASTQKSG